jgi:hypothetical protein
MPYLGPEVLMPIASVLAAVGGALLMFWNRIRDGIRVLFGGERKDEAVSADPEEDTLLS